MSLGEDLRALAASRVPHNNELALSYDGATWSAEIDNPSPHVMLGESSGLHGTAGHPTPEAAVTALLQILSELPPAPERAP